MRVLHVLSSREFAGAEQVALQIAAALTVRGEHAYASPDGPIRAAVAARGVSYLPLPRMTFAALRRTVKSFRPDVIHTHDYRASTLAAFAGGDARVVAHLHTSWPWCRRVNFQTLAFRAALPRIRRVILVSPFVGEAFVFRVALGRKSIVIPNVVDAARLQALAAEGAAERADLLFAGRLSAEKSPLEFIALAAAVRRARGKVRAVLIGAGALEAECLRRRAALGLQESLLMTGFLANPYPYMAGAKVVVIPSKHEAFGLVALEAGLLGVPVVARAVGGLPALIEQRRTGLLCQNEAELEAGVLELLGDAALAARLGANARVKCLALANLENYLAQIERVYQAL